MLTNTLKKIAALRAKAAALEATVEASRAKELRELPAKYGFNSVADFVAAVSAAASKPRGRKPGTAAKPEGGKKRRKRAVITAETKAEVKKLVDSNKTGAEIAKAVGISLPSVQNIKKELGLVKTKKKK